MLYGACYYPEHWPEERWALDAALMKEAHFNVVRMAEFAWARMEPEEGKYDFSWLDRAIAIMRDHGLSVILGTPTAGPPKWLMDKHPDMYQRDRYGLVRGFGTRRHYCFNHPTFRRYAADIVARMAKHYAENESVIGWQIDNEMGMIDTARCYCRHCLEAFKDWLRVKYGTIDAVNEAWGTIFSSQTFRHWDEIHLPAYAVHQHHNPGLMLDFYRFSSDSVISFQRMQEELIRRRAPGKPVTTNLMGKYNHVDCCKQSETLDIVAYDVYPNLKSVRADRPAYAGVSHDLTRGIRRKPFWILEHQSGAPGAVWNGPTPLPGEMRRWTMQSVAHGADAIVYFRWRTLNVSIEQFWHGILHHHGQPGARYEEAKRIGSELKKLAPYLDGTCPRPKVAILRSLDSEWAFEFQPQAKGYEYFVHLEKYYRFFFDRNIPVDVIPPETDLNGYSLVIAPNLMIASRKTVDELYRFVREGGTLVMDFRAGAREEDNSIVLEKLPGRFRDLLGVEVEEYGVIEEGWPVKVRFAAQGDGKEANGAAGEAVSEANVWYEILSLNGAEALAVYEGGSGALNGYPAVTRRTYGAGRAYYIATEPDAQGLAAVLQRAAEEAGAKPVLAGLPGGVQAASRIDAEGNEIIFVINHSEEVRELVLEEEFVDLLADAPVSGERTLAPQEVLVLRRAR